MIQTGLRKEVDMKRKRRQGRLEPPACSGVGRQIFTRNVTPLPLRTFCPGFRSSWSEESMVSAPGVVSR